MREIKFRAWVEWGDGEPGKMWYDIGFNMTTIFLYEQDWTKLIHPPTVASIGRECDGLFVEQFTGLKDKDGREIYEGDVVRTTYKFSENVPEIRDAIVEHDTVNPCFVLKWTGFKDRYEYDFVKCGMMTLEIIGNIHENQELLK